MNDIKQPARSNEDGGTRTVFWGTIALAAVTLLISVYFFKVLLAETRSPVLYFGMALFISGVVAMIVSIVLSIRGRQEQAVKLTLTMLLMLGLTAIGLFEGRATTASLTIFVISVITLRALFPSHARRNYAILVAIGLIVMWTIEWISPPWRIQVQAASAGPIGAAVFAVLLVVIVARQAWGGSLRNKVLISAIGLTVISTGSLALVNYYNTQSNLTKISGTALKSVAESQASAISNLLLQETHVLQSFNLSKIVQDKVDAVNSSYSSDQAENVRKIQVLDERWKAADKADNNNDPLVSATLNSDVASELREFQATFPENTEVFVTDKYGASVAATNRTSDYYQADEEWWQGAYNNGAGAVYVGQPEFDQSSSSFGLILAVPLYSHGTHEVAGVMRTTINIDSVLTILQAKALDGTSHSSLYLPGGQILDPQNPDGVRAADSNATLRLPGLISTKPFDTFTLDGVPSVVSAAQITAAHAEMQAAISDLGWQVVVNQSQADNFAPVRQQTRSSTLVALVILAFGVMFALFLAQLLSSPIVRLTVVAEQIAAGHHEVQAKVETKDEIGKLAGTFNSMTAQLRELIGSLEQRVADRTHNLELAAEVGRSVSQVRALDAMLKDACDLILKEFKLYYVQVYLTDPIRTRLSLEAGTGSVGVQLIDRGHSLPLDNSSINGRAAVEKHSVVIADTAQSATFRKNPLLPDTRGEMAVPLIVANNVVGVLDMQSREPGILTEEVLPAFEALAGQLAVAIQNSNLLAETEQARAEVEKQARRLVRESWNEHLDAIHKPEQLGFVYDSHTVTPLTETDQFQAPESGKAVSVPIALTGEPLGSLIVEIDDEARREQAGELVNVIAHQMAQQIENLRLLESAERYRYEAEQAARLQTLAGWQKYMASRSTESLGYLYDAKEVRPQDLTQMEDDFKFTLPLKARDETIGKLSVQGLTDTDQESVELVNAVAERLSTHVENLRLFEETRFGQLELDKRARQLSAVAEISTVSSQELKVDKLLSTVVHLTQRQFDLYHAHIFVYNEATQELQIAACGWKEGDENEGTHETVSIPLEKEQSLVARAARTRRAVIVNDVRSEGGWLANPLLPDTASEMAVPLVIGDRVLGVLDVQSHRLNAFTEEDANIQTTLASQVATAMQNARSFTQAQKQAERESMLNVINQKIQSATSVEAVLQIAARELGHALGAPMTIAQLSLKDRSS